MVCQKCGSKNRTDAKFCNSCGSKFEVEMSTPKGICPRCKKKNQDDSKFCIFCGLELLNSSTTSNLSNEIVRESMSNFRELFIKMKSSRKTMIITCFLVFLFGMITFLISDSTSTHGSIGNIDFCKSVTYEGKSVGVSKNFKPGVVEMNVKLTSKLNAKQVGVNIFKRTPGGEEIEERFVMRSKPEWIRFDFGHEFLFPGDYRVEIYVGNKILAGGTFSIQY